MMADVLLWIFGGEIYTVRSAARHLRPHAAARWCRSIRPTGWCCSRCRSAIGFLLWWFLNRTRVGMMIRAGVDDRAMLAAAGVNVQFVFAVTFAIGAGPRRLRGRGGRDRALDRAGRGHALPCSPRSWWSSWAAWAAWWGRPSAPLLVGVAEQFGLAYAPTYSVVFTFVIMALVLAFRPQGLLGARRRVSAAEWRKAMNAGAGRHAWPASARDRVAARAGAAGAAGEAAARGRTRRRGRGGSRGRVRVRHVLVLLAVLAYPWVATPFFTFQIGAQSLALGLIALSLTFLAGYGGMVSLAQMTVAGIAGYAYAIFATSAQRHQPPLAVGAGRRPGPGHRDGGGDPHRLVLGAHRGHLHDHDHAGHRGGVLLPGPAELLALQRLPGLPERADADGPGRRPARAGALLLPRALLVARRLLLRGLPPARAVRRRAPGHPRQPAAHERARLQRHRPPGGRLRGGRGRSPRSAAS